MIQSPVSVSFTCNGDILVAEANRRVQRFNRTGRSINIISWGNIQPYSVSVGPNGIIAVADKMSQTVRFYGDDGRDMIDRRRWPERMFGMPASVAIAKTTGQVVVVDSDRHVVTVHSAGGAVASVISSEHVANPTHVAVAHDGTVFVSDSQHCQVKVKLLLVCLRVYCIMIFSAQAYKQTLARRLWDDKILYPLQSIYDSN